MTEENGENEETGETEEPGEIGETVEIRETHEIDESGDGASAGKKKDEQISTHVITADGSDYLITVTYGPEAEIPEGAELAVRELLPGTEEYDQHMQAVEEKIHSENPEDDTVALAARFFDITILSDGVEAQPSAPVDVKIELTEKIGEDLQVFHFDDEGDKVENLQTVQTEQTEEQAPETRDSTVQFCTESFSVFAIVGTVIEKNVLASDGKNYKVTVTYGAETGIPEEAKLEVEEILPPAQDESSDSEVEQDDSDETIISSAYDEYVSKIENVLGMEEGSAGYIRLFDIKIVDQDDHSVKYQPVGGTAVDVRIELADKDSSKEAAGSTQVVHFHNEEMDGTVIENSTDGQIVVFEAVGFSIYAIVDSSKRLQYNFYDGTTLLASEYIKKQDNILQELYDPGVEPEYGQTFVGWAYSPDETNPSSIYTIEELNQQAAARYNDAAEELTEINVYAIYDEAWYLRYMDQNAQGDAIILNVVRVRKDAVDKDVTINYTFIPEEGIVFEGWIDVATGDTYQYGDTITLDHHVDLYEKLQGRNWIVFDSNAGGPGSGATYTPPQLLIGDEATPTKPADPTRRGYTFTGWNTKADGTGTWWYKSDGSVNQFGNTLSSDTTLYAQWEADDTDYYVVFWKQKATATGTDPATDYDYVSSDIRTAKTGDLVSITQADTRKGNYQGNTSGEYGYYFTYNADNSDTVSKVVNPDGTTQLNVYYDRKEITINYTSTNGSFTVVNTTSIGTVDGETVILYPDGNGGYYYVKDTSTNVTVYPTRYAVSNNDYDDNPVKYGWYNNSMVRLYYRDRTGSNSRWYRTHNSANSWNNQYTSHHDL